VQVTTRQAAVASPFGGLLYVSVRAPCSRSFAVDFSEACPVPVCCHGNPERWDATRSAEAPWAELQTQHITLTVPTAVCSALPSVPDAVALVAELSETMHAFLGAPPVPHRVVVDVGIAPPGIAPGYPIFAERAWVEELLSASEPSPRLLQILASIAVNAVPEQCFYPTFQGVLALLAAEAAVAKKWPTARQIPQPHLAQFTVWVVLSKLVAATGTEPISATLQKICGRGLMVTATRRDIAEAFVLGMSQRTKRPLEGLLNDILATETCPWSPMDVIHGGGASPS
jgi:hypothetical protein